MKLINNNKLVILLLLLVACTLFFSYKNWKENQRIKYVDTITLFNEFELTKELEAKDAPILNEYKMKLDSLQQVFQLLNNPKEKEALGITIYQFDNDYKRFSESSNKHINDLVWARLNKLINAFGKKNDFTLLFGANGMGTILYGQTNKDETRAIIEFCNKQYKNEK
jgi:outer membrane protein